MDIVIDVLDDIRTELHLPRKQTIKLNYDFDQCRISFGLGKLERLTHALINADVSM